MTLDEYDAMRDTVRLHLEGREVKFLDLGGTLRKLDSPPPLFFERDAHLSAEGHGWVAALVTEFVKEQLP